MFTMEKERCSEAVILHTRHVDKFQAAFTKLFTLFYSILIFSFISFRLSSSSSKKIRNTPLLPWLLVFSSELFLFFLSLLNLSYRFRPVSRTGFPQRLSNLRVTSFPAIDVFVFTADPEKEPPIDVMNTVISVMALDYPPEKLSVYISDDGGSPVTLAAAKEAVEFARWWVPFCKKYEVMTRCPKAYFGDGCGDGASFFEERRVMEEMYELFKERVRRVHDNSFDSSRTTHPAVVQIINSSPNDSTNKEDDKIPQLIYISREKSPLHAHHFKAGAINALLRVSSVITNAPYILMLDCDMYSNDPSSARQAMCFHLDPQMSSSLAFVQFPQMFHNLSSKDIYGSGLKTVFDIKWPGMDGLKGPMVSGTCFYMKRRALYGSIVVHDVDFVTLRKHFGLSIELIKSIQSKNHNNKIVKETQVETLLQETEFLASCTYEQNTSWGHEIGFLYGSVVEDYFTGFKLHCNGWSSVYCNPSRPAFLGTATTTLSDALVQNTRWQSGLLDVTLSKNFPLIYGPMRMSLMQSFCYASLGLQPFYSFPIWCMATIPQLCLIHGIAIYPKASSPWFKIFLSCFMAPKLKYLQDILSTGGSVQDYWNEDRMWMTRSVTSFGYGVIDAILKKVGLRQASFTPTNKVDDGESFKLYKMGKFNFQLQPMFLIPLVSITFLNLTAFVVGLARVMMIGSFGSSWDELIGQILLSGYVLVVSYPIIHGVLFRADMGRIQATTAMTSALFCLGFMVLGSVIFLFI